MNTTEPSEKTETSEKGGYSRRRFLENAALAVGAAQFGITGFAEGSRGI